LQFIVVIPSRFLSTRLPGKPLIDIAGKTMIQRVYEQASKSTAADVIVATDDTRIFDVVQRFGGAVEMTSPAHASGTDRLQEVVSRRRLADDTVVVNVQGDEPLVPPAIIDQVANNLAYERVEMATLSTPIAGAADVFDPNVVKVVTALDGTALYFSRAPLPWARDVFPVEPGAPVKDIYPYACHVGIYAYRARLLNEFVTWPVGQLERVERLEQLRVVERGIPIHVDTACEAIPPGVDTEKDLERVRQYLA
jgi:3-deoxy-manno-octulosonate cytidylyltransferase (CMP-KDO synthetase)